MAEAAEKADERGAKAAPPSGLVNFVLGDGQVRPALIVRALEDERVNLHVFLDGMNDEISSNLVQSVVGSTHAVVGFAVRLGPLAPLERYVESDRPGAERAVVQVAYVGATRTARATDVPHDAMKAPGTWHWPFGGELVGGVGELRAFEPPVGDLAGALKVFEPFGGPLVDAVCAALRRYRAGFTRRDDRDAQKGGDVPVGTASNCNSFAQPGVTVVVVNAQDGRVDAGKIAAAVARALDTRVSVKGIVP